MKALVIGATGATGKELVDTLLADDSYTEVVTFVRKASGRVHEKLTEHTIDFSQLDQYATLIKGDVFFSCLGTTLKDAGSKQKQWNIDYDIPAKFGEIARRNGVDACVLVSALGAYSKSKIFYSRMKGELEDKLAGLGFKQCIIFKPGVLDRPESDRFGERVAVNLFTFFNRLGLLRSFRPLPTKLFAQKLAKAPKLGRDGVSYVVKDEIFGL